MNKNKLKTIIILTILFTILLTITSFKISTNKELNFFEKAIKDTTTFIEKVFYFPIKYAKDKIEIYIDKKNLYKKYTDLKEKVEKTDLYYAQIEELQKELKELKSLLELNATLSEYTYLNATVVSRNIGYWYNSLVIDKGSKNGIRMGDAVIVNEGLIGRIIDVSNFSSTVKLLTTNEINNKISVKITSNGEYQYGLLSRYNIKDNLYSIEGISNYNNLKEGDSVTTTGLTDYFPGGILIGKVYRVVKDEYDLNSIVEVKPSVDFNNISLVTVLNRKAIE